MKEDPLDAVYSYVERAYIRLQAGDVLMRCMEEGSTSPIQQMVEGLVLAGPQSLSTLQEILAEAGQRKSQVMDDLHQVFSELEKGLRSYGVHIHGLKDALSVTRLTAENFIALLREQNISNEQDQSACLQLLVNSKELMVSLAGHIRLLEEIEKYLQDWSWSLVYQSARRGSDDPGLSKNGFSL